MIMSPEEKLDWLNEVNTHLSLGGVMEFQKSPGHWEETISSPNWNSSPAQWRMSRTSAEVKRQCLEAVKQHIAKVRQVYADVGVNFGPTDYLEELVLSDRRLL